MPSYKSGTPVPDTVPPGEYEFEVINAVEEVSSGGNPMITMQLRVIPAGVVVFDRLVFVDKQGNRMRIDSFRASIGENVVENEDVNVEADDLIGRKGRARLKVGEWEGRKRNEVSAWLMPLPSAQKSVDKPF